MEILKKFFYEEGVSADSGRDSPFTRQILGFNDYLYATDNSIVVRCLDDAKTESYDASSHPGVVANLERYFNQQSRSRYILGEMPDYGRGTGEQFWTNGETTFQTRYLDKLSDLPGIKFALHPTDPNGAAYFQWRDGEGFLMPCQPADFKSADHRHPNNTHHLH